MQACEEYLNMLYQENINFFNKMLFNKLKYIKESSLSNSCIVFSPHPDDEVLGCGGFIFNKMKKNAEIKIVIITDGSKSHEKFISQKKLKRIRKIESINALNKIGIDKNDIIYLDYEDGNLFQNEKLCTKRIIEIIDKYDPKELMIPHIKDFHMDHYITSKIVRNINTKIFSNNKIIYNYPIWYGMRGHGSIKQY